jgi:catechol 2,3-dioxygenase-like lactoylglutathione lyase family enzyme
MTKRPSHLLTPHHLALSVRDLESCGKFYGDILGLPVVARHQNDRGELRSVWLQTSSLILMLEKQADSKTSPDGERASCGWHLLALEIPKEKREEWKNFLTSRGIFIEKESQYSLYFRDPEGNRLALTHYSDSQ